MDQRTGPSTLLRRMGGFVLFSHGWTWSLWAVVLLRGGDAWAWPNAAFLVAGGLGVPMGGIVMTWRSGGRPALRELARRCLEPGRPAVRWWLVVLLFFPAVTLAAAGLHGLAGSSGGLASGAWARVWSDPAGVFAAAAFVLIAGPLPEEIGWRGFALDRLQRQWNALFAAVAVALLWATWHVPLYFLEGYYSAFGAARPAPGEHLSGVVIASVLYAWIYGRTGRSVLAVIVFHFFQNYSGELLGLPPAADRYQLWLLLAAALAVIAVEGTDLGFDEPDAEVAAHDAVGD